MKAIIVLALFIAPMIAPEVQSQRVSKDSIEVWEPCNCRKAVVKYRDEKGNRYDVWLDKDTDRVFIIVPYKSKFRRKYIDDHLYAVD